MVAKYGNMNDWKNACGTGAYMLIDYVIGSSLTYERNPNYWMKDPRYPENNLPYVQTIKQLIIDDKSTRLAAMRTGKLEVLHEYTYEDLETLLMTRKDLQYSYRLSPPRGIFIRLDKGLVTDNVKIRWAMSMAIDRESIVKDYYKGHAVVYGYPYPPSQEHSIFYVPLNELSQTAQDVFSYNVDKAKALMAEAGYASGFKLKVLCSNTDADFVSLLANYLSAIKVDLHIQVQDTSTFGSTARGRNHEEAIYGESKNYSFPFRMLDVVPTASDNWAMVNDSKLNEVYAQINSVVGKDDAEVARLLRSIVEYRLELVYGVCMPSAELYHIWQP